MLSVAEAAKRAERDPETIRRWIRAGKLTAWKVGSQHMIDEDDLSAAIRGTIATPTALGDVDARMSSTRAHRLGEVLAPYATSAVMGAPTTRPAIDPWLPQIVGRIVRAADPVRIILFGARVRGEATDDTDYELLVVLDDVPDRMAARVAVRRSFADIPAPAEIVVASAAETEGRPSGVVHWALEEGRSVYARDTAR